MDFQSLAEQVQLGEIAQAKVSWLAVNEMYFNGMSGQTPKIRSIISLVARDRLDDKTSDDKDPYLAEYEAMTDSEKANLAPLIQLHIEDRQAAGRYLALLREAQTSEYEFVREEAWSRVDDQISKVETGRFVGRYLQNVLYALSVGPFSSSDQPNDMRVRFQTGDYEHYNLPEFLSAHWLILESGIYGNFGERRSILTKEAEDILERLTIKYGKPEWAARIQPAISTDPSMDRTHA